MSAPVVGDHHGLWDLWDMLEFYAERFVGLSAFLAQMEIVYLNPAPPSAGEPAPSPLSPERLDALKAELSRASELAEGVQLSSFIRSCAELTHWIGDPRDPKLAMLADYQEGITFRLGQLVGALKADLEPMRFAAVEPRHVTLYEAQTPIMGLDVDAKFPAATYDIEEAGKCLALGRSTACVFHLMRAAEASAAIALTTLGGNPLKPNGESLTFGALAVEIGKIVDAPPQGPSRDDWLKVKAQMHSCNRAYRTKVAHPVDKYTESEADTTFRITRSLLEEIAALI